MTWEFIVWAVGLIIFLALWESHIRANPEPKPWSNSKIFGAWLVFMAWPACLVFLLVQSFIERMRK